MRREQRFPASIPCSLKTADRASQAGLIVDVSRGGAGIETIAELSDKFILVFSHRGLDLSLPCSTRHSTDLWGKRRIHAQFAALSAEQQSDVDRLIETLANSQQDSPRRPKGLLRSLRRVLRR